jgi:hypothetical protein
MQYNEIPSGWSDENEWAEGKVCPICPGTMTLRLFPMRDDEEPTLHHLSDEMMRLRQNDADTEWLEFLVCPSCGLIVYPDEYDDWLEACS